MPYRRTGLIVNTERAITPMAYSLDGIILITKDGTRLDIQDIVDDFTITESLFATGMILRCNIKDTTNIIEKYKLVGHEWVEVHLSRQPFFSEEKVTVRADFIVSEYPLYGKGLQQNTQVFTLVGISPHVFFSKLLKISRAFSKDTGAEISSILTNDLRVANLGLFSKSETRITGVFPFQEPLVAALTLAQNTTDSAGSPFFLYQTLTDGVCFRSYSDLLDQEPHGKYTDEKLFTTMLETREDYETRASRILSLTSDYRVSKLFPAIGGAYASKSVFVDIGTKSASTEIFNSSTHLDAGKVSLNGSELLDEKWKLALGPSGKELGLNDVPDAALKFFPENSLASNSYVGQMKGRRRQKAAAIAESLDSYVHTLTLCGDFKLNPGKIIQLDILKSVDFSDETAVGSGSYDDLHDLILSGRYIVTSVVHSFGEEYKCTALVKKDSVVTPL